LTDVIEHVVDPWSLLGTIAQHLAPGGCVVAAIPNVRHLPVSAGLLFRGRWTYTGVGILDRTHVRFFTRETVVALFGEAGYEIDRIDRLNPPWTDLPKYRPLKLLPARFGDLIHQHYGVLAHPRC